MLTISVVSFPLLVDRDAGAAVAVMTSIRAVAANPVTMALWGLIVAVRWCSARCRCFFGLAVVLPVLGHATWHLYRKVVEPNPNPRQEHGAPESAALCGGVPLSAVPMDRERRGE